MISNVKFIITFLVLFISSLLLVTYVFAEEQLKFGGAKPISQLNVKGVSAPPLFTLEKVEKIKFHMDTSEVGLYKINKFDYVKVGDLEPVYSTGNPQLPMKTFVVKLPLDSKVSDVKIVSGYFKEIENKLDIAPSPEPLAWLTGKKQKIEYVQNEDVYNLNEYFTGKTISYEVGKDNENTYVYVRFYPLQYIPKQKKAVLITDADIQIYYSGGFTPIPFLPFPPMNSSTESVIITPPEFYQQAVRLADFHEQNESIPTTVVNTTWIWGNYSEASDPPFDGCADGCDNLISNGYNYSLAKKIISFLNDANHPNLKYVTLFGEALHVPPSYYIDNYIVTDFFYSSPDYDLTPNYMVGRIPVNNATEAEHFVNKTLDWYSNLNGWYNNSFLSGGRAFGTEFYVGELIITDVLNRGYFSGMNVTKDLKTDGNFYKENMSNVFSNGNYGMVYHIGHGGGNGMQLRRDMNNIIYADDVLAYSPESNLPILVSIACSNGQYDINILGGVYGDYPKSFAEAVLASPAGAIAYIGGARTNYGGLPVHLEKGRLMIQKQPYMQGMLNYVFKAYAEGGDSLGNITTEALKTYYTENGLNSYIDNLTFFEFTLLGDSALMIPKQSVSEGYRKPNLTAIDPDSYVNYSLVWSGSVEVPLYTKGSGEKIRITSVTDSPNVTTKLIDTNRYYDETIEKVQNQTTNNLSDYSFIPPENSFYLVRTSADDGKEGWLYFLAQYVPNNLKMYLSGQSKVMKEQGVCINGELEPDVVANVDANLTFPNGTVIALPSTTSDLRGYFYLCINTYDYPEGGYKFTAEASIGNVSAGASLFFEIINYDRLEIFLLSSYEFNTTQCNEIGFRDCKLWPIELTNYTNETDLARISQSGWVWLGNFTTVGGETRYIGVVDYKMPGYYNMLFIDDDNVFLQVNETDIPEKGFIEEGDPVGTIAASNGKSLPIVLQNIARNGTSVMFTTPPGPEEIPYYINDKVSFAVLAESEGSPKENVSVSVELIYPRHYYQFATVPVPNSTTDRFGLTGVANFIALYPGSYRLTANDYFSVYVHVNAFNIKYKIKDADTGKEKDTFTAGDEIKFGVNALNKNGDMVLIDSATVELTSPSWDSDRYYVNLNDDDSDGIFEGTYTLSEDVQSGKWSVRITVRVGSVTQDVKTSFEVKTFEVMLMPTTIRGGWPIQADSLPPNKTAYLMVFALKLGARGDFYKMPEFYDIDDPNTSEDECPQNIEISKAVEEIERRWWDVELNVTNITNVENSDLYEYFQGFPTPSFLTQCVVKFTTPSVKTAYSGDVKVRTVNNSTETGRFMFAVSSIEAYAYPFDPYTGSWKYAFEPGKNVTLRIDALDLYNQERINDSDITSAKVLEIRGEDGLLENILDQDFDVINGYATLRFIAPNQTGHYIIKFSLEAKINKSGELINETGLGHGSFVTRLYDVWGYTQKNLFATNESVPIIVNVKDMSGTPASNIQILIDSVMNTETGEYVTDKIIYDKDTTDENGIVTITLIPTENWKEGCYNVRLKAIDPEERIEYGYAWFEVWNYIVHVGINADGVWAWEVIKGDMLTFIPYVYRAGEYEKTYTPLNRSEFTINLSESYLEYRGTYNSPVYPPKKVKLTDLNTTLWDSTYYSYELWAVNVSTNSSHIESGNYEVVLRLYVNGDETEGRGWFSIKTFLVHASQIRETRVYQPEENVTFNISVNPSQEFNVTLEEMYSYKTECGENPRVNVTADEKNCSNSCLYSVTLPNNSEKGDYSITLSVTAGGESEHVYSWFEVKNLLLSPPKGIIQGLYYELDNRTYVYDYVTDSSPCNLSNYNITIPPEIANHSCSLLNSTLTQDSEYMGIPRNNYLIIIDNNLKVVYIDTNKNFTDGNVTYNSTVNDTFTDLEGIEWVIKEIWSYSLSLESTNSLDNGVIINTSLSKSGKFKFGWFNESYLKDLDNDGSYENVYLLAFDNITPESYNNLIIGLNKTNLTDEPLLNPGENVSIGSSDLYLVDLSKDTYGSWRTYLAIPEPSNWYPWFGRRKVNTNVTFPVLVAYPNGSGIESANVSIDRTIKRTALSTTEVSGPNITYQTDSNGIIILNYNLTESGSYSIIPKAQVGSEEEIMDEWDSPDVEARSFSVYGCTYLKLSDVGGFESQDSTKLETSYFPKYGQRIYLSTNYTGVTPPNNVTNYETWQDWDSDWWFLVDADTNQTYMDNDTVFNNTNDPELQGPLNLGDDFWMIYYGKNITFSLLQNSNLPTQVVYGFDLGKYRGQEVTMGPGESESVTFNNKSYSIQLLGFVNNNTAVINVSGDYITAEEGNYYGIYGIYIYAYLIKNETNNVILYVSIGDLRIANYTANNGTGYNIMLLDTDYPNGYDRLGYYTTSYDTVLIGTTGNLTSMTELHPGNSTIDNLYLSSMDVYGWYALFLNGTVRVIYPPTTWDDTGYLVNKTSESTIDLNDDGDLNDTFYFVLYDSESDDVSECTDMIADDDNDLFNYWVCNGNCYPIDFSNSETGENEDFGDLPQDWILNSKAIFDSSVNNLALFRTRWDFNQNGSITVGVEAREFNYTPVTGNLTVTQIKTWENVSNASVTLKSELKDGFGYVTIYPSNFSLGNWTSGSLRIFCKVESDDSGEENLVIWTWIEGLEPSIPGGSGGAVPAEGGIEL